MKEYTFKIIIPEGLHARPCAKIVELLEDYAPVSISCGDKKIAMLSMLELLMMKITYGSLITISLDKTLPSEVENALKELLSRNY